MSAAAHQAEVRAHVLQETFVALRATETLTVEEVANLVPGLRGIAVLDRLPPHALMEPSPNQLWVPSTSSEAGEGVWRVELEPLLAPWGTAEIVRPHLWWILWVSLLAGLISLGFYELAFRPMRKAAAIDLEGPLPALPIDVNPLAQSLLHWQKRAIESENLLRRHEEKETLIRSQSAIGFIEFSPEMTIRSWNAAAERIFGFPAAEAIGRDALELLVPAKILPDIGEVVEALRGERGGDHQINENVRKDGTVIMCEWFNTVLHDRHNRVIGIHSAVADITETFQTGQRQAEAEARYLHLTRHYPNGAVFLFDRENRIVAADGELLRAARLVRADLIGKSVEDAFPEPVGHRLAPWIAQTWKGRRTSVEVMLSNREVRFDTLGPGLRGEPPTEVAMVLATDQTERIESLRALNQAKEIADQASAAKSAFLAQMSHELRTPLNAILGMCEILSWEDLTVEQDDHVRVMRTASNHLLGIINEVLDYSKMESGAVALSLRRIDLRSFVADVFATAKSAAPHPVDARVELADDLPDEIAADSQRLGQILLNLLTNAFKFTQAGHVILRAFLAPAPDAGLMLEVEDTGIGIEESALRRIFEPFQQAEPLPTRRHGGVGLGLAIARRLAEAMGGRLTATSTVGQGSVFRLALPGQTPVTALPETNPAQALLPMKALIVEDEPVSRRVLERMVTRLGLHPTIAVDGVQAVKLATQETFPLIFMDVQMPVMDGTEATRRILQAATGALPVVIGISAHVNEEATATARQAGMDLFVPKPLSFDRLRAMAAEAQRQWQERQAMSPAAETVDVALNTTHVS